MPYFISGPVQITILKSSSEHHTKTCYYHLPASRVKLSWVVLFSTGYSFNFPNREFISTLVFSQYIKEFQHLCGKNNFHRQRLSKDIASNCVLLPSKLFKNKTVMTLTGIKIQHLKVSRHHTIYLPKN